MTKSLLFSWEIFKIVWMLYQNNFSLRKCICFV